MQKEFQLVVDIEKKILAPSFEVNTLDLKSVKLQITITKGMELVDLTGVTVRMSIRKPDNNVIFQECQIINAKSGQVEITLENQAYLLPGSYSAEIMCFKGSDVVAVTGSFSYKSVRGIMTDEAVESKSEFTAITGMIKDTQETINDLRENGTGIDVQARNDIQSVTTQLADIALNVKHQPFNAKSNGVDDDHPAIQSAINQVAQTGKGYVYLPDGVYKIKSSLLFNKSVKLMGQSRDGTVLLIDSSTDINVFDLWAGSEIYNLSIKIENSNHTKAAFRYLGVVGGSRYGKVHNIKIAGAGYNNQTKAIELSYDPAANNNAAYVFYWDFKDIVIDYCLTAWYTEADFTKMWSTACTFENFVINRTRRAVWFNAEYKQGWFSRYDFLNWQYQCLEGMVNVFESPADRSIVDLHVWDRHLYPTPSKAIVIKGLSINNTFKIRNIGISDVEFEKPVSAIQNTFQFSDGTLTKSVITNTSIYVDSVNGSDVNGDGSQINPYRTVTNVLNLLPKEMNANITILLADNVYNENLVVPSFYGNGLLTIQGGTTAGTKVNAINITRNKIQTIFKNITVQKVLGGIAILQADSELTFFEDVNIIPNGVTPTHGYYIQNSQTLIKGNTTINNCDNAVFSSGSSVVIYNLLGSGNKNGLVTASGTITYRSVIADTFSANKFVNTLGGFIHHRLYAFGLAAIQSGETSIVVKHNLGEIPNFYNVTPQGNVGYTWISNPTTTEFKINCSVPPSNPVQIGWEAKKI